MIWYTHKFWRIAWSASTGSTKWDSDGTWVHVIGPIWFRVKDTTHCETATCEFRSNGDHHCGCPCDDCMGARYGEA